MNRIVLSLLMSIVAISFAGIAMADPVVGSNPTTPSNPFTIKLGAGWTSSGADTGVFEFGGDYAFIKSTDKPNPVMPSVYIDGFSKDSNTLLGVGVAIRQYSGYPGTRSATPYYGIGLGDYFFTGNGNYNSFGGKLMLGAELPSHLLGEVNYTEKFSGNGLGIFGVEVGYRF